MASSIMCEDTLRHPLRFLLSVTVGLPLIHFGAMYVL
jgi:hypothetical protein